MGIRKHGIHFFCNYPYSKVVFYQAQGHFAIIKKGKPPEHLFFADTLRYTIRKGQQCLVDPFCRLGIVSHLLSYLIYSSGMETPYCGNIITTIQNPSFGDLNKGIPRLGGNPLVGKITFLVFQVSHNPDHSCVICAVLEFRDIGGPSKGLIALR